LNPDLQVLMEIQFYSDEKTRLKNRCQQIPEQIGELDTRLSRAKKHVDSVKEKIRENELRIRKCESHIRESKDQQGKYRAQLFKLKSNREYQALNAEIETLADRISLLETEIIESMEIIDEAHKEHAAAVENLSLEEKRITSEKKLLNAELQEEKRRLTEMEKAYSEKRNDLSDDLLSQYDKLVRKNGRAVAELSDKNCGNCFVKVQPQIAASIQGNSNLVNCDKCGVFLFVSEDGKG
jgi:uncharacterized protein